MDRRSLLKGLALGAVLPSLRPIALAKARAADGLASRVRPGDPGWPSAAQWQALRRRTGGRLIALQSPLDACRSDPGGAACREFFRALKNPYYIGDAPNLTQTCGWVDAWTAQPSVYAVAAETTEDVVAAVDFAREHNLRLVVKGGGHSYLGTSNAPDSLLIWMRAMRDVVLHDGFVGRGCEGRQAPERAVSVGAGALWMQTYDAVTTRGGRYVQGGGCGTVGVAGLVQGGGFGSHSKRYGTAGAGLLEAEIVTADGRVRVANACTNPDLHWALKGGGGGSFGVVTRLTLRTPELPAYFGVVAMTIRAASDAAFHRLIGRFVGFYAENLLDPHWGEIATLRPGNTLEIGMAFQGFDQDRARSIWAPFLDWLAASGSDYRFASAPIIRSVSARHRWDPEFLKTVAPRIVLTDDRPGAPPGNIFWTANLSETGHFLHGFESIWLPASLLDDERRAALVDALAAAGRLWSVELHFQKGLAGAPADVLAAVRDTPMNPDVLGAFALAIVAGEGPPAFPGLPGHEPDMAAARRDAGRIGAAMAKLRALAPDAGSYVAESSYFEENWQASYWGPNYARLLAVKRTYDPSGLFFVRHGVGSEGWSEDGFTTLG